ncbi:DNA-binding protein [Frankia sp. AgB32]|uniref:helix-turn-helix transcriptional regulator n=1 Tax=Frankia sp. AgB32 TaxID=631119 RepID=UPI00200F2983|nr:DNA-binding protein [Frankia sp. AgB32]MCK9895049.1 DNA-binding protein [Frankia sp. AgB32]
MAPPVMGTREVADRLGVSRQYVLRLLRDDPTFPRPIAELSAGLIWNTDDIESYANRRERRRPDT